MEFGLNQYAMIADKMRTMKGKAITSVNDTEAMRKAFHGLVFKQVKVNYTVCASRDRCDRNELVILNFSESV